MLLPKDCRITTLIVSWCDDQVVHAGRGITINQVTMSGFWVIGLNIVVRSMISKCVRCKHLRGGFQLQKMADLPRDRMSEKAPFAFCGVMFGPFVVKNGRKELKQYGALCTCLSSRAIHIEVTFSLNTDSFILCLRRFIGRRENVHLIRSDMAMDQTLLGLQQS